VRSAHDCSDGGIAITLAESSFDTEGIGCEVDLSHVPGTSVPATLFGETASCVVVSARPADLDALLTLAAQAGVPAETIGRTGGSSIRVSVAGTRALDVPVSEAEQIWSNALGRYFARNAA
jgi:phosphoribosylformylglycinamidine (FGAM) synthase-like enzyme